MNAISKPTEVEIKDRAHSRVRLLLPVLTLLFAAIVAIASLMPFDRVALGTRPPRMSSKSEIEQALMLHYAFHICGFATLAILARSSVTTKTGNDHGPSKRILAACSIALLGWATEFFQARWFHHPIEMNDVAVNVGSALITSALASLIKNLWGRMTGIKAA